MSVNCPSRSLKGDPAIPNFGKDSFVKNLIWQNVTEGPMNRALRDAEIVLLSEADPSKVRAGRPVKTHGQHRIDRLKGLLINWNRSQFRVTNRGYRIFHKSGTAEGWENIPTPARGLIYVVGYWLDDPERDLYCYWVTHFLNEWNPLPARRDKTTVQRYEIVEQKSIPVVEELVRQMNRDSKICGTIGGGDTNSIPWNGHMLRMEPLRNRGLDRVWSAGNVNAAFLGTTPETGSGPQMYHEGVAIIQKPRKRKD